MAINVEKAGKPGRNAGLSAFLYLQEHIGISVSVLLSPFSGGHTVILTESR